MLQGNNGVGQQTYTEKMQFWAAVRVDPQSCMGVSVDANWPLLRHVLVDLER